jgi:hypothetical protein
MAQQRRDVVITGDAEASASTPVSRLGNGQQAIPCGLSGVNQKCCACGGDICNVRVKQ